MALLDRIRDYEYEQRFFIGEGKGMRVSLESKWLGSDWQWFIGVHCGDLSEQECLALLRPGALNWKLGSARRSIRSVRYGAEGLHMRPLAQSAAGPAAAARLALFRGQPRQHRLARRAGDPDPGDAAHGQPDRQSRQAPRRAEHRRRSGRRGTRKRSPSICSSPCSPFRSREALT